MCFPLFRPIECALKFCKYVWHMIRSILRDVCHVNKHLFYRSLSWCIFVAFYIQLREKTYTHAYHTHTAVVFFPPFKTFQLWKQMRSKYKKISMVKKWLLHRILLSCFTAHELSLSLPLSLFLLPTALCPIAHATMRDRMRLSVRTHVAWLCKSKWTWRRFCTFRMFVFGEIFKIWNIMSVAATSPSTPGLTPHSLWVFPFDTHLYTAIRIEFY